METRQFGTKIIVRLDPGEEVIESLMTVCREYGVKLGTLSGIGAVNRAVVGLFETERKHYHSSELKGDFEITALTGNISTMNGETYLHLHVMLADIEHRAFGGHLNAADVSATAEIVIDVIDGQMDRAFSETIGLNLFKF